MNSNPTREQLQKTLSIIDSAIPRLKSEYPDEETFWPAFAGLADQVVENLTETDGEWAYSERLRAPKPEPTFSKPSWSSTDFQNEEGLRLAEFLIS